MNLNLILTLKLFLLVSLIHAQNLVPNFSFEHQTAPPHLLMELNKVPPWFSPNLASPDLFCVCGLNSLTRVPANGFGFQYAHSGDSYVGISVLGYSAPNYVEYLSVELLDTLVANTDYWVRFYASLADKSIYSTNKLGVYFSSDELSENYSSAILITPQFENDNSNPLDNAAVWTKIEFNYTANGDEKYLTIGNFNTINMSDTTHVNNSSDPLDLAYFYIDDVCVSTDTTLCDISLNVVEQNRTNNVKIFPVPFKSVLNVNTDIKAKLTFKLYNSQGMLISETHFFETAIINTENFINGLYFYSLEKVDIIVKSGLIVK